MTAEDVAGDPRYLLHSVDPVRRQLLFRPTTAEALRGAAFIDGRTDIWAGPEVALPFDAAVQLQPRRSGSQAAIFHLSFCGSTLLARLLDRPGKVLALKEPNCLADLAGWKAGAGVEFDRILRLAAALLARPWAGGEQVLLKPSSWANNLIDELGAGPAPMRALFVTMARDRFLEAVIRGGSDRLAFTARLGAHLAPAIENGTALMQAAMDSAAEPMAQVARLALVAHDLELRLFERAIAGGRLASTAAIDFADLEQDPAEAASRAAAALQLGLDEPDIAANVERWARANAKADAAFSLDERRSENAQVRSAYGALIDDALAWGAGALGPPTLQAG